MRILRQASCVVVARRAILIEGPPGIGKSTLALALIDRGALLVGDDGVTIERTDAGLHALPPPNIAGKLEIRNVGIVTMPATQGPVALMLRLTTDAPRLPEDVDTETIAGSAIPALDFFPGGPVPALRAEWALATHGLPLPAASAQG